MENNQEIVENVVETVPLEEGTPKKSSKKLPIIIGAIIVVIIGILAVIISRVTYENAYDKYCEALISSDAKALVDMCPDSFITYLCDSCAITEDELIDALDYSVTFLDFLLVEEYGNYKELSFITAKYRSSKKVNFNSEDGLEYRNDILKYQYPSIAKYEGLKDSELRLAAEEIYYYLLELTPCYVFDVYATEIVLNHDGDTQEIDFYLIDGKWYPDDLLRRVSSALQLVDRPYSEQDPDLAETDANIGDILDMQLTLSIWESVSKNKEG